MSENTYTQTLRDLAIALSGAFMIAWLLQKVLEIVTRVHWALAAVIATIATVTVVWVALRARGQLGNTPTGYVVYSLSFATVVLTAVGGWTSITLYDLGHADYVLNGPHTIDTFIRLYLLTILDLLPGFDVLQTLSIELPAEPKNTLAGVPVVAFKFFVVIVVLGTFNSWRQLSRTQGSEYNHHGNDENSA